jgi:hypothetical protein
MSEYLALPGAPEDEMHAAAGDTFRETNHYLQSNYRKAEILSSDDGYDIKSYVVNARKQQGVLACHTVISQGDDGTYSIKIDREWAGDVESVGDDSICFMMPAGIAEYWSIRDPAPGTTQARIRLDHPWIEWGDKAILPSAVKISANVRPGSAALAIGSETGILLTVKSVSGEPALRCVYPRSRGYYEVELTWPKGPRKTGDKQHASFVLQVL